MLFQVKDYHSETSWEIGRGAFGKVYLGYHNPLTSKSYEHSCLECSRTKPSGKQVAIKVEKMGIDNPCLYNEALILKAIQGAPGIPEFHLFSRTELPCQTNPKLSKSVPASPHIRPNHHPPPPRINVLPKSPLSSIPSSVTSSSNMELDRLHHHNHGSLDCDLPGRSIPTEPYCALVMERLGKNIGSMFRKFLLTCQSNNQKQPGCPPKPSGYLTPPHYLALSPIQARFPPAKTTSPCGWDLATVVWIGFHLICRLEHMHGQGFVHRDIKPENLCVGYGEKRETLYLIDYGMAKAFRTPDGAHVPPPPNRPLCVGTQAFMSSRCEGSRRDDIESLAYVLLFLYRGSLPWTHNANRFEETFAKSGQRWTSEALSLNSNIQKQKVHLLNTGEGLENLPLELRLVFRHIGELRFDSTPNYRYLRELLKSLRLKYEASKGAHATNTPSFSKEDAGVSLASPLASTPAPAPRFSGTPNGSGVAGVPAIPILRVPNEQRPDLYYQ